MTLRLLRIKLLEMMRLPCDPFIRGAAAGGAGGEMSCLLNHREALTLQRDFHSAAFHVRRSRGKQHPARKVRYC